MYLDYKDIETDEVDETFTLELDGKVYKITFDQLGKAVNITVDNWIETDYKESYSDAIEFGGNNRINTYEEYLDEHDIDETILSMLNSLSKDELNKLIKVGEPFAIGGVLSEFLPQKKPGEAWGWKIKDWYIKNYPPEKNQIRYETDEDGFLTGGKGNYSKTGTEEKKITIIPKDVYPDVYPGDLINSDITFKDLWIMILTHQLTPVSSEDFMAYPPIYKIHAVDNFLGDWYDGEANGLTVINSQYSVKPLAKNSRLPWSSEYSDYIDKYQIRNRVFKELAKIKNVNYDFVYNKWEKSLKKGRNTLGKLEARKFKKRLAKHSMEKGGWIEKATSEMKKKGTIGSFTKMAKKHGDTPVEYAKEVLDNPSEHTLKTRRKAQFVKNTNPEKFGKGGKVSCSCNSCAKCNGGWGVNMNW